ncbi:putative non-specific serine/threonine protein kinase [Helianthus anomalus]
MNMNVHLGDFLLAKAMTGNHDSMTSNSNMWFAGSDIYSLGMVLLKLVTGRMPTVGTFGENVDMVRWVESRIEIQRPKREELIDRRLKPLLPQEENGAFQVLV